MKLLDIVVRDAITAELEATERDKAIGEIISLLVDAGAVDEALRDEFIKTIIKREKQGSTGFGHGVAVPHVKHKAITTMVAAVAVSQGGVEFKALDQRPVHSIFLLLSPADAPAEHLDAMNAIFGSLQKDNFRSFLRQASTVQEIITLLEEADAASVR